MSTIDSGRLRTFGQNMATCLELIGKSIEDLATETNIKASTLEKLPTGKVKISIDELQLIAREFNLSPPHLTRTYAGEERRRESLAPLLAEAGHKVIGFENTPDTFMPREEIRLPPVIRSKISKRIATEPELGDIGKKISTPPSTSNEVEEHEIKTPEISHADEPIKNQTPPEPPAPKKSLDVDYVIIYDGVSYDLLDRSLRLLIADRIRFARGSIAESTIGSQLKQKRHHKWFSLLGGLKLEELEEIATICSTTVRSLITGEGIVELRRDDSASTWMKRYVADMQHGEEAKQMAEKIRQDLKHWPEAIRIMIAKYLIEIL